MAKHMGQEPGHWKSNVTATRWVVGDPDPKIRKSQDDFLFAPLSKTSGRTTAAVVQPNGRHELLSLERRAFNILLRQVIEIEKQCVNSSAVLRGRPDPEHKLAPLR